jgi:hypothetical protein
MSKAWFTPKRYGYGSGLPCSWEGWVVLAGYLVAIPLTHLLAYRFLPPTTARVLSLAIIIVLTIGLVLIAKTRTESGWRWRSGNH